MGELAAWVAKVWLAPGYPWLEQESFRDSKSESPVAPVLPLAELHEAQLKMLDK